MKILVKGLLGAVALAGFSLPAYADTTLTIATVNNGDMIRMQKLTDDFTKANPDIKLNWVTLEENVLRQKVTTDIATKGGQFDVLTIGTYEVPIWGKKGWLVPLDKLGADYDVDDLLPAIRAGLTVDGKLYAAPFYGESSMVMYRKDLMDKAGLKMPDAPTWDFIKQAADKMTDKAAGVYGICLRGKAGWGENMAFLTAMANSFGARWFDEKWQPQFEHAGVEDDARLLRRADEGRRPSRRLVQRLQREPGAVQRRQVRHVDRRHGRRLVRDRPEAVEGRRQGRLRAGARQRPRQARQLAVGVVAGGSRRLEEGRRGARSSSPGRPSSTTPSSSPRRKAGPTFLRARARRSTRTRNMPKAPVRQDDAGTRSTRPTRPHPTVKPVPYVGVQFVAIPEFQGIGTDVGQDFSAALAGTMTVDAALAKAQATTEAAMKKAGYIK